MNNWKIPADDRIINKTVSALKLNNINAVIVENAEQAKQKVLELLPPGSEVMTMTSMTLEATGLADEINNSGKFDSVRSKLNAMNRHTDSIKMQKLGAAPDFALGSVHAVTEDGKVLIASNSGSQLPGYAYGSSQVIWVVGSQKIVKDINEGFKRIYEHTLPLESERAKKAYGVSGSFVSKLLIFNREPKPDRITLIFVKESLGF